MDDTIVKEKLIGKGERVGIIRWPKEKVRDIKTHT